MNWLSRFLAVLKEAAPIRFWAMVGASVILTVVICWQIWIIAYGAWPYEQAGRRLDILGKSLWINLGMVLVIVVSLTSSKLSAKGLGGSVDIAHDDSEQDHKTVITTTKTEVKP